jgi:hypothetical protein
MSQALCRRGFTLISADKVISSIAEETILKEKRRMNLSITFVRRNFYAVLKRVESG